jgi:hypothetical protein
MQNYQLQYLFIAETFDGQIIKQDLLDRPRTQTTGSSFSDVLKHKIKKFSLVGKGHIFAIDLIDGHLEVDGRVIYPPISVPLGSHFDLIYYRRVQQKTTLSREGKMDSRPVVRYFFGWKTEVNGKTKKWEMGVD